MKVKVLRSFANVHGGFGRGKVIDLADEVAQEYIKVGYLAPFTEDEPTETQEQSVSAEPTPKPKKQRMTKKAKPLTLEGNGNEGN